MGTILFFEDDEAFAKAARSGLTKRLGPSVKVTLAKTVLAKTTKSTQTFVHRLFATLKEQTNVAFIVADVNLYDIESYRGLSAEVVSEAAKQLYIPVCIYSRKVPTDFERIQESVDATIKLVSDPVSPEMLGEIMNLYEGFDSITKRYRRLGNRTKAESLPRILATILGRPQYVDRFSLYGPGNQLFPRFTNEKPKRTDRSLQARKVPYILGNWLLLSVLKFPGIILNDIAAASHLNISPTEFKKHDIRTIFRRAQYSGPFSGLGPFWWRYDLDNIVDKSNLSSGVELARDRTGRKVKSCKCSVDQRLDAGYYCIATNLPVSLEKSTGEISFIPKGADLARVSKRAYDKLKPWIGVL